MDTTPSPKMFEAMNKLVDATVGDEPSRLDQSTAAIARRGKRAMMMDVLHHMIAVAMREGVRRKVAELKGERAGLVQDRYDREALARAKAAAEAGERRVSLPDDPALNTSKH